LTPLVAVVGGFISFGLVFMGMMCVLPTRVGSHAEEEAVRSPKLGPSLAERAREKVKVLTEPDSIDGHAPHFR